VLATPALGRFIRERVRPLISLTYPVPNQVPRLVHSALTQLVPTACMLSLNRTQQLQLVEARTGHPLSGVSKKSATERHGMPPEHPARRSTSTPQHPLIRVVTLYARSGRRGRGFKSRHPEQEKLVPLQSCGRPVGAKPGATRLTPNWLRSV